MLKRFILTTLATSVLFAFAGAHADAQSIESKVAICGACHGASGTPTDPKTMPPLWGQTEFYIYKQLLDYRSGDRENALMSGIAKSLQPADLRAIAAYFAGKTPPTHTAANPPAAAPEKIALCKICHQANFQGALSGPRLAGLSYEYISAQMRAFTDGKRANNADMPKVMNELTESERDAMAHYIAGL
jgi:cytochrome c553